MGVKRRTFGGIIAVTIGFITVFAGGGGRLLAADANPSVGVGGISINLHIGDGGARLTKISHSNHPYFTPPGGYQGEMRIELLSNDNRLLYEKRFKSTETMFWDELDPLTGKIIGGYSKEVELTDFLIDLPDFQNAARLKIYKQRAINSPTPKVIEQLINTVQLPPRCHWEVIP